MPRIIAGTHKGMNLYTPAGTKSRPTSDRAKEALFSIIGDAIEGARVLDIFAGSGQITFEALSRGALHATLIERDSDALASIRKNIAKTGWRDRVSLLPGDFRRVLSMLKSRGEKFDFIYIDPPWIKSDEYIRYLMNPIPDILTLEGLLVIESESGTAVPDWQDARLKRVRSCQYGISVLSFYQM